MIPDLSQRIGKFNFENEQWEAILVTDVKEFIRLLKEQAFEWFSPKDEKHFSKIIDKLAGDKLL